MSRPEPLMTRCDTCDKRVLLSGVSRCESEAANVCIWCALSRCATRGHLVLDPPLVSR